MSPRRVVPAWALVLLALLATASGCTGDDGRTDSADPSGSGDSDRDTDPGPPPGGSDLGLRAAQSDVASVAPQLESYLRGKPYPETVAEVEAVIEDAGLGLYPGNGVGAYRYDREAEEFQLCVENVDGGWAIYDTAPMTTQEFGKTGSCPELDG